MVVALVVAFRPAPEKAYAGRATVGRSAPGFVTTDLAGRRVTLASQRGKTVLLNFWASWCVPCRREFPVIKQFVADHPDVVVLGIVYQDSRSAAAAFMRAQGATWRGLQDPGGSIADRWGAGLSSGLPQTWVVDGGGVVRGRHRGEAVRADLEELVRAATPSGR